MKVVIDPGHGGSDPGAIGQDGTREADITLDISLKLKNILELSGYTAILTRGSDTEVAPDAATAMAELQARCDVANNERADLFMSIHCNAAASPSANGSETWYHVAGKELADIMQCQISELGLADRGVKQGNFYVLTHTDMPAILAEIAFISDEKEEALLRSEAFRWAAAKALAKGINKWNAG